MSSRETRKQYLDSGGYRSGRIITEAGDIANHAEALMGDIGLASRNGTLFRGFWQDAIPGETTYDFVIDVPAGIDLFGFVRVSETLTETIKTTFLTCTGYTSAEGPISGLSLDRREGRRSVSQGKIHRASAITEPLQHSPERTLYVGTPGPARAPSSQTDAGAEPAFDSTELPVFRYENTGAQPTTVSFYLFWQELLSAD